MAEDWPALLLTRTFDGLSSDGHLHNYEDLQGPVGELDGVGDIRSFNWDGGSDLSSADTAATEGILIDMSEGAAQFMRSVFLGGDLQLLDGDGQVIIGESAADYQIVLKNEPQGFPLIAGSLWSEALIEFNANWAATVTTPAAIAVYDGQSVGDPYLFILGPGGGDDIDGAARLTLALDEGDSTTRIARLFGDDVILGNPDGGAITLTGATDDQVEISVGGVEMLRLTESTADVVNVGPSSEVDLQVGGASVNRGEIAYAEITSNVTPATGAQDVTGLTVTFTPKSGRRYRTTAWLRLTSPSAAGGLIPRITDGSNNDLAFGAETLAASENRVTVRTYVFDGGGSEVTHKVRVETFAGRTITIGGASTGASFIMVEDIGAS